MQLLFISLVFFGLQHTHSHLLYCPCMGRFGNQADQFLGTLYFAKQVNRTLVLPPWIEYINQIDLNFRPFTSLFQLSELKKYHDVIPMEDFMKNDAPTVWPVGKRKVFCYTFGNDKGEQCLAKDGRPFGNFWNHFKVDFDSSASYKPLTVHSSPEEWTARYPLDEYPVMAFMGAPGSFPIQQSAVELHRFLAWTPEIDTAVEKIIADKLERPFVAIHLRHDIDFTTACDSLVRDMEAPALFDSAQCHGFGAAADPVTMAQCAPPLALVAAHARQALAAAGARTLYVATDNDDDLEPELRARLGGALGRFHSSLRLRAPAHIDLALLGRADAAVLNCVSSFSAFARRERDARGLDTEYFGHTPLRKSEL